MPPCGVAGHALSALPESSLAEVVEVPSRSRSRGSNQVGMRQFNERVVLQALRTHGPTPKAELARLTGLTAQTIGLITARLDEDQLLRREAPIRGKIGQPSVPLGLNPDGAFAVGIKVGRRSADWLLVDFDGVVRRREVVHYPFPDAPTLIPLVDRHLQSLLADLGPLRSRVVGVGVAAPFQMGGWHRMMGLSEAQAAAWNGLDLQAAVQRMTDLPVSFAKDTAAATVAELVLGKGRHIDSFLYLFVDTFVGGGLVLHSHLHRGVNGNAGAVASLPLHTAGGGGGVPPQLVSQVSLWDLEQRLRDHGLDATAAYDQRALLDPWATHTHHWLQDCARALAHCVVSGTAFLDVDAVVVDGSMAPQVLALLLAQTRTALGGYSWEGLFAPPRLEAGSLGTDARAVGGALLPLHACFAPDHGIFLKA